MRPTLFNTASNKFESLFACIKAGDLAKFVTQLDSEESPYNLLLCNCNNANLAHLAAISNQQDILRYLGKKKPELFHQKTALGFKPIDYAIINQDLLLFKCLADLTWYHPCSFQDASKDGIRIFEYAKYRFGETNWFTRRLSLELTEKLKRLKPENSKADQATVVNMNPRRAYSI